METAQRKYNLLIAKEASSQVQVDSLVCLHNNQLHLVYPALYSNRLSIPDGYEVVTASKVVDKSQLPKEVYNILKDIGFRAIVFSQIS